MPVKGLPRRHPSAGLQPGADADQDDRVSEADEQSGEPLPQMTDVAPSSSSHRGERSEVLG
jgi:hypothetical protein